MALYFKLSVQDKICCINCEPNNIHSVVITLHAVTILSNFRLIKSMEIILYFLLVTITIMCLYLITGLKSLIMSQQCHITALQNL